MDQHDRWVEAILGMVECTHGSRPTIEKERETYAAPRPEWVATLDDTTGRGQGKISALLDLVLNLKPKTDAVLKRKRKTPASV